MAAIIGLVGGAFLILYVASQRYLVQDIRLIATQGEASYAIEHITRHLIQATEVTSVSGIQITFKWKPTATSELSSKYERSDTGDLEFIRDSGSTAPPEPIARGVLDPSSFSPARPIFSVPAAYPHRELVEIDLTVRRVSGGDVRDTRLRSSVSPRGVTGS